MNFKLPAFLLLLFAFCRILKSPLRVFGGRSLNESGLLRPVTILKE